MYGVKTFSLKPEESCAPRNGVFNVQIIHQEVRVQPSQLTKAEVDQVKNRRLDGPHGLRHVHVKLDHLGAAGGQGFDDGEMETGPKIKLERKLGCQ